MCPWTKKTSRLEFNSRMTKLVPSTLSALYDYTALVAAGIYILRPAPLYPFQLTAVSLPVFASYLQSVFSGSDRYETAL